MSKKIGVQDVLKALALVDRNGPRQYLSRLVDPTVVVKPATRHTGPFLKAVESNKEAWTLAVQAALAEGLVQKGAPAEVIHNQEVIFKSGLTASGREYSRWEFESWIHRFETLRKCIYLTKAGAEKVREMGYSRNKARGSRQWVTAKSKHYIPPR